MKLTKVIKKQPICIIIVGIAAITLLEIIALLKGIDGIMFGGVVALIGAAIGITIPTPKLFKK